MLTIAMLYPHELTLYGENGNIKALTYALEKENIKYKLIQIEKEEKLDFSKYDFVYLGSGRENNLQEIKQRLLPYKEEIHKYIKTDKILLATGNAISILTFLDLYKVERYEKRKVYDVKATTSLCKGIIKGFQNTEYLISTTKNIIFNIEEGIGNHDTMMEGFNIKTFSYLYNRTNFS